MKRTGLTTRHWLATLALTTSIWAAPAIAQSTSSQGTIQPGMPPQGTPAQPVTRQDQDDLNRRQLAEFDQFLDRHPEIAQELRRDPSLVRNQQFVSNHSDLAEFLENHPAIQRDLDQNPNEVLRQEQRFDRREDDRDRDHDRDRAGVGIPQSELEAMRQFLNTHPEIAEQLQNNPRLIDNRKFVDDHSNLKQFLAEHPQIRQNFDQHPYAFMQGEDRDDRASRLQMTDLDQFLDKHPEIAQQLRKNPSLITNKDFVQDHAALQQFLTNHPQLTAELQENPNGIMRQEDRFDRQENLGQENMGRTADNDRMADRDGSRRQFASFHEFLENHSNIASELEKNPSLATNSEYLQNHAALQTYLNAHPEIGEQLSANPQGFIKSSASFDATGQAGMKTTPKPMPVDPMKKQ